MSFKLPSLADQRRLCGMGSPYESWTRPVRPGTGGTAEQAVGAFNLANAQIRQIAQTLEEGRIGGTHLPEFDWRLVERLMEEAEYRADAKGLAARHWDARFASTKAAEADKAGDAKSSHTHHSQAAQLHRAAAAHLRAGGGPLAADVMAKTHEKWADHHDAHAAHHAKKAMSATTAHTSEPEKPQGKFAKMAQAVKGGKSDAGDSSGAGKPQGKFAKMAQAAKGGSKSAVSPAPSKSKESDPEDSVAADVAKSHAGVDKETQGHVVRAMKSGMAAHAVSKERDPVKTAAAHKSAAHDSLHAALSLFHGGHHDKALEKFNAAIHHMSKHAAAKDDSAALDRQAARRAEPAGPRARTGMTSA